MGRRKHQHRKHTSIVQKQCLPAQLNSCCLGKGRWAADNHLPGLYLAEDIGVESSSRVAGKHMKQAHSAVVLFTTWLVHSRQWNLHGKLTGPRPHEMLPIMLTVESSHLLPVSFSCLSSLTCRKGMSFPHAVCLPESCLLQDPIQPQSQCAVCMGGCRIQAGPIRSCPFGI